jgi:hypothetical protein
MVITLIGQITCLPLLLVVGVNESLGTAASKGPDGEYLTKSNYVTRKPKCSGINLSQSHFVHVKSNMGLNPGFRCWKTVSNHMSYCTALPTYLLTYYLSVYCI